MNALVIPSCRQEQLTAFFGAWRGIGGWDRVYLIEDNTTKTFDTSTSDKPVIHFSHKEIAENLGTNSWIVSKKDSACRSYGFYKAWQDGADYILTLDDDVRPHPNTTDITQSHISKLNLTSRYQTSVQGLVPRGLPIKLQCYYSDIKASMGIWSGVPDLWAEDMLEGYPTNYIPPLGSRVVPSGELVPICGMNLCIHRDAVPLCYFPPMGEGQPYSRYDDIWMGLILKLGLDVLGWRLSIGEPFIRHERASNVQKSAKKEEAGKYANNWIWRFASSFDVKGADIYPYYAKITNNDSARIVMHNITARLKDASQNSGYFDTMSDAIKIWANLFIR